MESNSLSVRTLEAIVGKAVISERFRAGILNGKRGELIRPFELGPEETSAVMSIRACDLSEFAQAIELLTRSEYGGRHDSPSCEAECSDGTVSQRGQLP